MCSSTVHPAEREDDTWLSVSFFKLADGDPLESVYNAIHICENLPHGNDICITITNIFEKHVHVS